MTVVKGKYGGRKVREGTVVSDKMQKTVLVAVEEHVKHRLYKKRVKRVHKFMAHDENETAHTGDRVRIVESRPVSRFKRWAVVEVIERIELPEIAPESIDLDLMGEGKPAESAPVAEAATPEAVATEAIAEPEAAPEETVAEPETVAEEIAVEEAAVEPVVAEQAAPPEAEEAVTPEAAAEVVAEPEAAAEEIVVEEAAVEPAVAEQVAAPEAEEAVSAAAEEPAATEVSEPAPDAVQEAAPVEEIETPEEEAK